MRWFSFSKGTSAPYDSTSSSETEASAPAAIPADASKPAAMPIEQALGALAMALLVLITLANVVVRYLTNRSFAWTEEISVFLLVAMTLVGSAWAALHDVHIRIDYYYMRGSARRRRLLGAISALATAFIFGLLAVLIARAALAEYSFAETTPGLGVPRWWYTAWLPALALWVAIRALVGRRRSAGAADATPGVGT